jgi:uncharacterized membrane protein YhhN
MGGLVDAAGYFLPALLAAAVDWYAVATGRKRLEYVFKPLTIVLLIVPVVYFTSSMNFVCDALGAGDRFGCPEQGTQMPSREGGLVIAALVFSLAGDVFLMLPRNLFVVGLASFLGAHVCYIIAFQPSAGGREPLVLTTLLLLLVVGAIFYSQIRDGLAREGMARLIPAVLLYIIVISQMVASAVANNVEPDFPQAQAAAGTAGALLFYLSDALIAWTRFVKEIRWAPVVIHASYHLAQVGLVLSFVR